MSGGPDWIKLISAARQTHGDHVFSLRHVIMDSKGGSERIAGAVLAAGRSRRMRGQNKLLLPVGGVPAAARICRAALETGLSPVLVVLGHQEREVRAAVENACGVSNPRLRFIVNPGYREGRMSSVAEAVRALRADCDAVMFLRGDQPWVSPAFMADLVEAYRKGDSSLAFPVHNGRKGSPTIVGAKHFARLLEIRGDRGTLELVREFWESSARLAVEDPRCLRGIDTPEDVMELLGSDADPGACGTP